MPNCKICHVLKTRLDANGVCKECRESTSYNANDELLLLEGYAANGNDRTINTELYDVQTIDSINLDKPVAEMSVRELQCIFKLEINVLETKVTVLENTTNNKINSLEKRVELLERCPP